MVIDIDTGTAITAASLLVASWYGIGKLMFMQFEKRLDERFVTQNASITELKTDIDSHMAGQSRVMDEIRRMEALHTNEFRRLENEISRVQLEALQRFQTKSEATSQHSEILSAIRSLGTRIDQLHAAPPATQ